MNAQECMDSSSPKTVNSVCPHKIQPLSHDNAGSVSWRCSSCSFYSCGTVVFRGKQMGEMQTVYHDRLQMSFCGQRTLLCKWFGQWKREEKYNRDKSGKWECLLVCLAPSLSFSVHRWSVIGVIEIDFQVDYFVCLLFSEKTIVGPRPSSQRSLRDTQVILSQQPLL